MSFVETKVHKINTILLQNCIFSSNIGVFCTASITPVPLASLLKDPKLTASTSVNLEQVFLPASGAEDEAVKRKLPEANETRSKRARTTVSTELENVLYIAQYCVFLFSKQQKKKKKNELYYTLTPLIPLKTK